MNKITLITLATALSCSSLVHAGGMGGQSNCCSGFVAFEGGYTVNSIGNYNFTLIGTGLELSSIKKSQHYTGRLAVGMINMMDDNFASTAELGWGYYGRTSLNPSFLGYGNLTIKRTITGFDALVGVAFIQPNYSLSFKAGALIQNMTTQTSATLSDLNFPFFNTYNSKENQTAALPEIKLGAAYNIDNNWSLTAAYLFALGSSSKTTGTFNVNTSRSTISTNSLNPTINSLLLGIQFTA
jgi:hypothetical protein